MRLSSVYLYEKIKEKYEILKKGNLSGNDGYLRPFLRCGINRDDRKKEDRFRSGHVYVIQVRDDEEWERVVPVMKDIFWIFCKKSDSEKQNDNMIVGAGTGIGTGTEVEAGAPESFETDINRNEVEVAVSSCDDSDFGNIPYIQVALENLEEIAEFMNDMQEIFDTADGWERKIHDLMLEHVGMERLLQVTSEFLQNPLTVIGLDFTFVAEAGSKYLPPRARLYTDEGLNVEYVNALLQNETYREMADTHETVMFPAYISGCRSMNRNLFVDEKATHRLILTECRVEITQGVICVLDILSEKLEFLLAHEEEETDPDRDIEQIFVRVLSDRTADYMQISLLKFISVPMVFHLRNICLIVKKHRSILSNICNSGTLILDIFKIICALLFHSIFQISSFFYQFISHLSVKISVKNPQNQCQSCCQNHCAHQHHRFKNFLCHFSSHPFII